MGIRVRVERGNGEFAIFVSIHHAVTDGIGITRFMGSWFAVYRRFRAGRNDVADILPDPALFSARENLHFTPPEPVSFWNLVRGTATEIYKWFRRRPIPLTPLARLTPASESRRPIPKNDVAFETLNQTVAANSPPSPLPVLYWMILPAAYIQYYKQHSKAEKQSVNTLILTDFYFALQQWTQKRRGDKPFGKNRYFRILIPTSLRRPEHARLPMANLLGYVFLDYPPKNSEMKQDITRQTGDMISFVQKWASGAIFLEGVRFFRRIPFLLFLITSRLFCHCSIVFSNPGMICRFLEQPEFQEKKTIRIDGELELIHIIGVPPVRQNTPVSIGVVSCGDETALSFCVDEKSFSPASLLDYLKDYFLQLEPLFREEA